MNPVRCTGVFLNKPAERKVWLGLKKRGFGANKPNGFGGKLENNESFEANACRETFEEAEVVIKPEGLIKVAALTFYFTDGKIVYTEYFLIEKWEGEPQETEEMRPKLYSYQEIPYAQMWVDDILWLPRILEGEKLEGEFYFNDDATAVARYDLRPASW
jgi:8-oxo-dGTP pyrophosphatase MutT (NUDIX family)